MTSAAILAGGRARRCGGVDKSRLVVGGRTILARQLEALSRVADDVMIVGRPRAEMPDAGDAAGVRARAIDDRVPGCGPLGGLDAALAAATHPRLVVLACDMPGVSADFLGSLLARADEADAVVPRTERGYHPLCAVYTDRCRDAVAAALAAGRLRMLDLLKRIRVCEVGAADIERFGQLDALLANVNTLAELDALPAHEP